MNYSIHFYKITIVYINSDKTTSKVIKINTKIKYIVWSQLKLVSILIQRMLLFINTLEQRLDNDCKQVNCIARVSIHNNSNLSHLIEILEVWTTSPHSAVYSITVYSIVPRITFTVVVGVLFSVVCSPHHSRDSAAHQSTDHALIFDRSIDQGLRVVFGDILDVAVEEG